MLLLLALVVACTRPVDTECTGACDTEETGVEDTGEPLPEGIAIVQRDTRTLAEHGLNVFVYEVTPEHPAGFLDNDGDPARFRVVRPKVFDPDREHPVLVWLHGGVMGVDDNPDFDRFCHAEGLEFLIWNATYNHPFAFEELARRGWVMLVPESTWCDLWSGLGPQDPVDPNHKSVLHIDTALDALEEGLSGLEVDPGSYFLWGTSVGALGVYPVAWGMPGEPVRFSGLVSDSGPVRTAAWWQDEDYRGLLRHVLGGPAYEEGEPSAWWANYARVDGALLAQEHGFRVPAFVAHNRYDEINDDRLVTDYIDVALPLYRADGVPFFEHDFRHHAPGVRYHTQSAHDRAPWFYVTDAAFRFLEGERVALLEAEDLCPTCAIHSEEDAVEGEHATRYSGGAAVASGAEGLLFRGSLARVVRGVPVDLALVLTLTDASGVPEDVRLLTMRLLVDGEVAAARDLAVGDLSASDASAADQLHHLDATTWRPDLDGDGTGDPLPEGEVTLEVWHAGPGVLRMDAIWVFESW